MSEQDTPAQETPPLTLRQLGERAASFAVIAQRFKKLADDHMADFNAAMLDKYRAEGARVSVDVATGPEHDRTAAVGYTVRIPTAGPKVTDEAEFVAHCEENYPHQVEWEAKVRPAFVTALLKTAVRVGDGNSVVDPATGVVVAGMSWMPAPEPSSIQPSWKAGGRERLVEQLLADDGARTALVAALALPASGTQGEESA